MNPSRTWIGANLTFGRGLGRLPLLGLSIVLVAGCGAGPSRSEVLTELASDSIVPTYAALSEEADQLAAASSNLCRQPSELFAAEVLERLGAVRELWSRSEAMWVGPVMDSRSWARVDWPVSTDEIEELLVSPDAMLDADYLGSRVGADQRGLGAAEYLLNGTAPDGATAASDPDRCAYLVGVTEVIATEAATVAEAWAGEDAEPYTATFADPAGDGLDTVVNDVLFLLEDITDREIGPALGITTEEPNPDALTEGPGHFGLADLRQHVAGIRLVLVGTSDGSASAAPGLTPLLSDELAQRLTAELDEAEAALDQVDGPLQAALTERPQSLATAREAIKAVQTTVATEVVAQLGVTIGFSDADGDTGG